MQAPKNAVGKAVVVALDVGYRHIDGAMLYENEEEIGEALERSMKKNKLKREDLFITSKVCVLCQKVSQRFNRSGVINMPLKMSKSHVNCH